MSIRDHFGPKPTVQPIDPLDFLQRCFASHGVNAVRKDSLLILDDRYAASAEFFNERQYEQSCSVQLDVRFACTPERVIVESCAGLADDVHSAKANACESFLQQSFHVLLAAFFQRGEDQVDVEQWNVSGNPMRAVVGGLVFKGLKAAPQELMVPNPLYYQALVERLRHSRLSNDIHWLRLYFAYVPGAPSVAEVLLDNETWDKAKEELGAYPWPMSSDFYSLRLFLILLPEDSPYMETR